MAASCLPGAPSGIVTLTTDFGDRSGYAGSLRGVLLSHGRHLRLVDISHEVAPFDIMEGALTLRAAAPHFPPGTVHLAVVDPGVGGARQPIIVMGAGQMFVGPDNGIFTPFLDDARVIAIDPSRVSPGEPSPTFHGRDLFAPVAARLAMGESPYAFGPPIEQATRVDWPAPVVHEDGWRGVVLHLDRFGNAVTNLPASLVEDRSRRITAAGRRDIPLVRTYAEAPRGQVVALAGSSGLLEVAVVEGSAADLLGLIGGAFVTIHPAG